MLCHLGALGPVERVLVTGVLRAPLAVTMGPGRYLQATKTAFSATKNTSHTKCGFPHG
jgi:hypothetical protein